MAFAVQMLEAAEVAMAPEVGFGEEGEGYVRLALLENKQGLQQAVRQMGRVPAVRGESSTPAGE